ncbi:hypothetical protein AB0M20_35935, partial [Actinoplanes sp. NPDC051633]|uniref:hypothetical protein n=1 Tax=Actinoplanes sp. NPDC051633 TaxID=3155670 RepID=UPI00342C5B69
HRDRDDRRGSQDLANVLHVATSGRFDRRSGATYRMIDVNAPPPTNGGFRLMLQKIRLSMRKSGRAITNFIT